LSLADLVALPPFEIVAVNQCSGNSRGYFEPRVAGGERRHGQCPLDRGASEGRGLTKPA
jgi:hypothetical protein